LAVGEVDAPAGAPGTVTLPFVAATLESVPAAPPLLPANCWTLTRTVLTPPATPCHDTANIGQLDPPPQPVPSWKPATRTEPAALSMGDVTGSAVQPGLRVIEAAVATAGLKASVTSKPLTESPLAMEAVTFVLAVWPAGAVAVPTWITVPEEAEPGAVARRRQPMPSASAQTRAGVRRSLVINTMSRFDPSSENKLEWRETLPRRRSREPEVRRGQRHIADIYGLVAIQIGGAGVGRASEVARDSGHVDNIHQAVAVAVTCPEGNRWNANATRPCRDASTHSRKVALCRSGERVRLAGREAAECKAAINCRDG
jgi:hypothetical protein